MTEALKTEPKDRDYKIGRLRNMDNKMNKSKLQLRVAKEEVMERKY